MTQSSEEEVKVPETEEVVTEEAEAETDTVEEMATEETAEAEENSQETSEEKEAADDADDSEASDAQQTETKEESKDKKDGFFAKKKKDKKDEQIEELNDKLRRQMAEFDNFRKRTEKEKSQMFDMGARTIIEKVLPIVDNFERGLAAVPEEQKEDAFVTGMDKVYKQLMQEFDSIGVKAIEAVGEEFNPELHNAVMQVESEEFEPGVIAQELQKGYMYKDTVVRHSMVAVVKE
ncbi:MAG: nucleotide exchange factor GrpE [Lachnospiraceae bacterium]|nr:nucleotide exchange factor GrpE [Lachnospiraceae bacterium]